MNSNTSTYIIPNSFKYPLFNEAMENELLKIIEWLKTQSISATELELTENIITELIYENRKLTKEMIFSEVYQKLSEQYDIDINDDFLNRDFKFMNQNIKIIPFELSILKPFIAYDNHELLRILSRYYFRMLCEFNHKYYSFLHLFFIKLYADYIFIKEIQRKVRSDGRNNKIFV